MTRRSFETGTNHTINKSVIFVLSAFHPCYLDVKLFLPHYHTNNLELLALIKVKVKAKVVYETRILPVVVIFIFR